MIHVILYHPEIPSNTGNIMRTCVAAGMTLHIIGPLPFDIDDKHLKRAGMDYIQSLKFHYYENYDEFNKVIDASKIFYVTRYGKKSYTDIDYAAIKDDIYLMFGRESTGIKHDILRNNFANCVRIPMVAGARSLNLANSVAIVTYEVLRQLDFKGLSRHETVKGENFLFDEIKKD
jgi:tRNA (cytidine/uridine-2'-O-)-methyltransferase